MRERGHQHSSDLCDLKEVPANEAVAKALGVKPGARVFHSLIVHRQNGIPIQVEDRYVNPAIAPDYLSVDFERTTPNEYLVKRAPIGQVRHEIEAVMPGRAHPQAAQHRQRRALFASVPPRPGPGMCPAPARG